MWMGLMVKESEILGSLRAGVQWTPAVFAHAQRESVDSFFSQNSYVSYDVLHKLSIPQPRQYLQSRYPEGIPLEGVFVHPSLVEMLDATIEDAVDRDNWIDSLSILPAYVGGQDVSKILSLCPSVQKAIKSSKAIVLGESCIFSNSYIKEMFDLIEKGMDPFSYSSLAVQGMYGDTCSANEPKSGLSSGTNSELKETGDDGGSSKYVSGKGSKKKRGKATGSAKVGAPENNTDNQENISSKSRKNQQKAKDASSLYAPDTKSGTRKGAVKVKEDNLNSPSEEWITQRILALAPDPGELGDPEDPNSLLRHLSNHLRPMVLDSWKKKRNTVLLENSERRRQLLDNLQKRLSWIFSFMRKH